MNISKKNILYLFAILISSSCTVLMDNDNVVEMNVKDDAQTKQRNIEKEVESYMKSVDHNKNYQPYSFGDFSVVTPNEVNKLKDLDVGTPSACICSCAKNSRILDLKTALPSAPLQ